MAIYIESPSDFSKFSARAFGARRLLTNFKVSNAAKNGHFCVRGFRSPSIFWGICRRSILYAPSGCSRNGTPIF